MIILMPHRTMTKQGSYLGYIRLWPRTKRAPVRSLKVERMQINGSLEACSPNNWMRRTLYAWGASRRWLRSV